jgi:hypothetical protein
MPRQSHKAILKRYNAELSRSKKWRQDGDRDLKWERMIALYEGNHYTGPADDDQMVVNRAFKTKNVIAPSVAVRNPKFMVQAQQPDKAAQALLTEEILNYVWRTWRYKAEFRLAVDDNLTIGHGWLKVGYKFVKPMEIKTPKEDGVPIDDITEDGVDDRADKPGNVEYEKYGANTERAFVERISPFDMFVDPDARHLGDARWIAQRVRRLVADVRVDGRYSAVVRSNAQGTIGDKWERTDREQPLINGSSKGFCEVWEFYDLRENTVCTILGGSEDGFLIAPVTMPYAFGHPFVMIRNYDVPDKFYPMGDLESIEALQHELNKTRTEQMQHRRGNQRKYLAMEDALDEDAWEALESDKDGAVVKVNSQYSLAEAVQLMPTHTISADAYNMSDIIDRDIDDITGVSDFNQTSIRRTATEAAMIQDQSNARSADKLARIEDVLAQIGERLIQLMQQYMTGEHVIRVVGSDASPIWLDYDKDTIAGKFDFEVEGGSTSPQNESSRRQGALQFSDAMMPLIDMGVVDPRAVARKILLDFGVKDPASFMSQEEEQPQPGEEMPPEEGMMPPEMGGMPGMPPGMPPEMGGMSDPMADESPIAGIPAELANRLNIDPSPALQM